LSILKQVAEGLVAIHAVGVVHRDIKPRNILLSYPDGPDKPHAKITDFGIAAIRTAVGSEDATLAVGAGLTRTGMILGTPEYMAPEAFGVSSEVGPPGDMFSFGVLIRRLLRVDGESFALPLAQMLTLNPDFRLPSIATVVERVDPALVATLDACLQTEAWRRPTANDVVEALVVIEREWNGAALDEHASNAP
jgi:serine/threonine protein kinase